MSKKSMGQLLPSLHQPLTACGNEVRNEDQAGENEEPQPHVVTALGLRMTK